MTTDEIRDITLRLSKDAGWTGIYTAWSSPTETYSMDVPVTPEQLDRFVRAAVAHGLRMGAEIVGVSDGAEPWEIIGGQEGIDMLRDLSAALRAKADEIERSRPYAYPAPDQTRL